MICPPSNIRSWKLARTIKDPQLVKYLEDSPELVQACFDVDVRGALDMAHACCTDGLLTSCLYQFQAMLFGLSSTLWIFTKWTQTITDFCLHLGIRIIYYLDDLIIMARSREMALQHCNFVLSFLAHLRFLLNLEKTDLALAQCFTFLGLCWDTHCGEVALTSEKVTELQSLALAFLALPLCSVWKLLRFLGGTNFVAFAVPLAWLCSHELQRVFYNRPHDCFRWCILSEGAWAEFHWWQGLSLIAKPLVPPTPMVSMATEASCSGWGVTCSQCWLACQWSPE